MRMWEIDGSQLGLWKYLWEKVTDQCSDLWQTITDLKPSQPGNRPQKFIRSALALFNNLSSLFIYVVLLIAVTKIGVLWLVRSGRANDLLASFGPHLVTILLLFTFLFFASVRLLVKISNFIKSYRIMTLIGLVSVVWFLAKGAVVLVTAKNLSDLGHTSWQFLLSALK
jgi:hypothetical protein